MFTCYAAGYCRRLTVALWALWFQLLVAGVSPSLPSLSPCESRMVLLMAVSVRVWAWRFLSETVYTPPLLQGPSLWDSRTYGAPL